MTVRDSALDVMRRYGLTTIFGNPGSTEITFLTDLPDDFRFVLALHEGSVVGIATGVALATGRPAFVNLHTAARARQRDQRHRQRPRLPRPARDPRRPAGPPPDRDGPVPHRPRRSSALAATTPCGPRFRLGRRTFPGRSRGPTTRRWPVRGRPSSSCRWATGSSRPTRSRSMRPFRWCGRVPSIRSRSRRWPTWSVTRPRWRSSSGRGRTPARAGPGSSRSPSGSAARCGRRRSAIEPGSPRTIRCSPDTCRGCAGGWPRGSPVTTSWWRSGPGRSAPICTTSRLRSSTRPRGSR